MFDTKKHYKIKRISEKNFGYTFSIIFLLIFLITLFVGSKPIFFLLFLSLLFLLLTYFKPSIMKIPSQLWQKFGILISKITNPIIIFIIYFGVFVVIGLIIKILYNDYFNYKIKNKNKTYWIKNNLKSSSMKNQF